jgi:D-xylose transport system substrate-binding protein
MAALPTTSVTGTVAFMVPDSTDSHWLSQDGVSFQNWMKQLAPNVKVLVLNATGDPTNQLNQAKAALTQGATVLAVAAVDGAQAGKIAVAAQAANAHVIAYTRDITGGPVTYMVGADPNAIGISLANYMVTNTKAGDTIAIIAGDPADSFAIAEHAGYMSVLQPLFDSKARLMVGNVWTPG